MERAFDRIVTVMFENQFLGMVMQNPTLKAIAAEGRCMLNYHGAFHPSQTNYLASVAGAVCGISHDDAIFPPLPQQTIVDLLDQAAAPLTWRAYMEDYPHTAWDPDWATRHPSADRQPPETSPGTGHPPYYKKHDPFASFTSIQRSPWKWSRIVDFEAFARDVARGTLPEYSWITPNIWNDGHYLRGTETVGDDYALLVDQVAEWLEQRLLPIIGGPSCSALPPRTLVVLTWDEAAFLTTRDRGFYQGPNQIYTVLLGDMISPAEDRRSYSHYSLLATVERNFGLPSLGRNDAGSNTLRFLWGEAFAWEPAVETGLAAGDAIALTEHGGHAVILRRETDGRLTALLAGSDGSHSDGEVVDTGLVSGGPPTVAAYTGGLVAAFAGPDGSGLQWSGSADGKTWQPAVDLGVECDGPPTLLAYTDAASGAARLMLLYPSDGMLQSLMYVIEGYGITEPAWQPKPMRIPFRPGGMPALGWLPHTLIGAWPRADDGHIECISYNTAPFNAVPADFPDESTIGLWSPRTYAAKHYPGRTAEPHADAFRAAGPVALATLDGELHLVHRSASCNALRTAVLGNAGLMTSKYSNSEEYGTLDQAGWSESVALGGAVAPDGALALATVGGRLLLLYQPEGASTLSARWGGWQTAPEAGA